MSRGLLRIYLGAAPGVGKTYAMLDEARRRLDRGADVVIGVLETHGRARTESLAAGIEVVPPRGSAAVGADIDVDEVLARRPRLVLVDDLSHPNSADARHRRRWQDVDEILTAGIDVIATLNVQHLESLNDVVQRITGHPETDTVPDAFVRAADQIELVDMSPEALRRRLAHGNVFPADQVDAALADRFRPGNLAAMRELALLWVADRVDDALLRYRSEHGITGTWETRERVVVALTGAPTGDRLIRRAARIAGRARGELIGVHVAHPDGRSGQAAVDLQRQRSLLAELGGTFREVVGSDVAPALAAFAQAEQATQVVLGATRRGRWEAFLGGSVADDLQRRLDGVDVHIIATDPDDQRDGGPLLPRRRMSAVPRSRERAAWVLALVTLPLVTTALVHLQRHLNLSSALLVQLALVVLISALGGIRPGVVASLAAFVSSNWFLTPPAHTLSIADTDDVIALAVFTTVAIGVSVLVDRSARRSLDATRARADAAALARSSGAIVAADDPMPELTEQLRVLFGLDAVAVLAKDGDGWRAVGASGERPPHTPLDGTAIPLDADGTTQLVLSGRPVSDDDVQVLRAFADQMALGLEAHRLRMANAEIDTLAEANVLRTALLQAVSHDLRTPLASIKASVTGLMEGDVGFSADDRATLLGTIDASADRLDRVIGNLLDMSRLQARATRAHLAPTALEEVVAAALGSLAAPEDRIRLGVDETTPMVLADPALLERAVANIVSNALAWSPSDVPVRIDAALVAGRVQLRIIDRGPGIPAGVRAHIFEPFQRMGDRSNDAGVGLGLAIAKGFVEVTGGSVAVDDTPGGGTTFTITLPVAPTGTDDDGRAPSA